jgi:Spy/CpxP family protein refolding chaperone
MKKHVTFFAVLSAIILMASSAIAQDATTTPSTTRATTTKKAKSSGGGAAGRADKELADLTTKLTLTADQQAKIKPILTDESTKIHAAKKASTGSADDAKAKSKAIRTDANQQIRALLTPDQQKTFDEAVKKGGTKKSAPAAAPAPTT